MAKKKSSSSDLGVSGGKGDVPRSCFSKQFRDNYDAINWNREEIYDMPEVPSNWNASVEEICNTFSPKKS